MLKNKGIIEDSDSLWASPIIPVGKPNGDIRICVDYRRLSEKTKPTAFYIPTVEEIIDQTGQSTVISKLDLAKGFHQVPMAPEDKEKNSFYLPCRKISIPTNAIWSTECSCSFPEYNGEGSGRLSYICTSLHRRYCCLF